MAVGDITAIMLDPDGWSIYVTVEGWAGSAGSVTYDLDDTCTLSVDVDGFNSSASPITVGVEGLVTTPMRAAGTTNLDETDSGGDLVIRLALSKVIYSAGSNFTISLKSGWANSGGPASAVNNFAVINASTQDYHKPIAQWAVENDYLTSETDGLINVSMFAAQKDGKDRTPVAAVKFIASDGVNPDIEVLTSTLTNKTYSNSPFSAPLYEAQIDLTTLNSGEVTIDAVIYPYIGSAFTLSTDSSSHPSANLSVLKAVNNYNNGYGVSYVYVSNSGDDGTGVASSNQATAQANPFLTIPNALIAARAYNNTNYSRNDVSNTRCRLEVGTYIHAPIGATPTGIAPLVIESSNSANRLTTIYQEPAANSLSGIPAKLLMKNLRAQKVSASNIIAFDASAGAGAANLLSFSNVDFHDSISSGNAYGAWIYRVGRLTIYNCSGNANCVPGIVGQVNKATKIIGSDGDFIDNGDTFNVIASRGQSTSIYQASYANREESIGQVIAFSQTRGYSLGAVSIGDRGIALVGSVFEKIDTDVNPCVSISADNITVPTLNILEQHCTIVGSRTNDNYQDVGTTKVDKISLRKHNIYYQWNCKSDLFGTVSANRTGNWGVIYQCDALNNIALYGATDGLSYGAGNWLGEIPAPLDQSGVTAAPLLADFANDQSFQGGQAGNGDYSLGESTEVVEVDTSTFSYGSDLYGNSISAGTSIPGAAMNIFTASGGGGGNFSGNISLGIGLGLTMIQSLITFNKTPFVDGEIWIDGEEWID